MIPQGKVTSSTSPARSKAIVPDGKLDPEFLEPDHALWEVSQRNKTAVVIRLVLGDEISGLVVRFGLYSVAIKTGDGRELVVFKNAIATATLMQIAR